MLRIFRIIEKTSVEGPGLRFCLWVQGCSRHCLSCFAKETWAHNGGSALSIEYIFQKIENSKGIEGVTFLGGEPFEQSKELSALAEKIKAKGLSLMCFTGFKIEELQKSKDKYVQKLLKQIDLLVDSPFEIENFDLKRPWVGSSNQRYIFLTDRYNLKEISKYKNKIEIRIAANGSFCINGMGDFSKIEEKIASSIV